MKIKDILNENNIKWLYESQNIVDDIDYTTTVIVNKIHNIWKNKGGENFDHVTTDDGNNLDIKQTIIKFSEPLQENSVYENIYDIHIYYPQDDYDKRLLEYYNLDSCQAQIKYSSSKKSVSIYIPLYCANNKIDTSRLYYDLSHEITHSIQLHNNKHLGTKENYKKHNEEYMNIMNSYRNNKDIIKIFAYICYYFTRSEISARVNSLYTELKARWVNKDNYKRLYNESKYYKEYYNVMNLYNYIINLPIEQWEPLREVAQTGKFYKIGLKLATTTSDEKFKEEFKFFYDRMVRYANNLTSNVINKAIQDISKLKK
jgi:hypothetical protein